MTSQFSKIQLQQLKTYGLNPYHWIVDQEDDLHAELVNIEDPEIRIKTFINKTENGFILSNLEWCF